MDRSEEKETVDHSKTTFSDKKDKTWGFCPESCTSPGLRSRL
jgi:hypothetical protein